MQEPREHTGEEPPEEQGGDATEDPVAAVAAAAEEVVVIARLSANAKSTPPYRLLYMEAGGDPRLLDLEPQAVGLFESRGGIMLDVDWRYEEFDAGATGLRYLKGDVAIPPGYFYGGEPVVEQEVFVYDPAAGPVETIRHAYGLRNCLLPLGMGEGDFAQYVGQYSGTISLELLVNKDYAMELPAVLDPARIDLSRVGSYQPLVYDLPPCFQLNRYALQGLAVHVIDPQQVDLRGWQYDALNYRFDFTYFKELEQPEIWMSESGGAWQLVSEDSDMLPYLKSNGFTIYITEELESGVLAGQTYEFQVRYENGGRSVNTFLLDELPIRLRIGGDRTGGDRGPGREVPLPPPPGGKAAAPPSQSEGGDGSAPGRQPARNAGADLQAKATEPDALPAVTEAAEQAPPQQSREAQAPADRPPVPGRQSPAGREGAGYTTVLGSAQFAALIQGAGEHLLLTGEDGLLLWLPKSEAAALEVSASFALLLDMPAPDTVRVAFAVDGIPFTGSFALPFVVGVPKSHGPWAAVDAEGRALETQYDGEESLLLITAHAPGAYRLLPPEGQAGEPGAQPAPQPDGTVRLPDLEEPHNGVPVVAFASVAATGGVGLLAGLRRRRRRRKE